MGLVTFGVGCSGSAPSENGAAAPTLEVSTKRRPATTRRHLQWRPVSNAARFELTQAAERVAVDRDRIAFVDRPDGDLARAPSLGLKRLSRDDRRELLKADPYSRGHDLVLYRGQAEEHLERVANGLEHSFHFASKPSGGGDLVVELEASGLRFLNADAQGLHFRAGEKLVHYGAATWVDAKGSKSPVTLTHANGTIKLSVSSQVLDGSAYPAVLDPLIQTEFIVAHGQEQPTSATYGCSATQCLYVWRDGHFVFGRRTSFSGDWVEPDAHRLMRGDYYPRRVSAGPNGDYLITLATATSAALTGFVVHSDMSVDSDAPSLLYANDSSSFIQQPSFEGAAVSQGVHHLFYEAFNDDESEMHRFALRVKDGEALGSPIDLGKLDDYYEIPSFSAGASSVLVTQNHRVVRIDAATGNLLDVAPLKISDAAEDAFASRLSSTFDGQNFVLFWTNSNTGRVHAARLRENDGALLDAQGVGATGSRTLCSSFKTYPRVDGAVVSGRVELLLWDQLGLPYSTAVAATSLAADPWASSDAPCGETVRGHFPPDNPVFGGNQVRLGEEVFTFWNDGITGDYLPIPAFTKSRRFGGVVSNGRDFLLLSEPIERIDGATGAMLGSVTVPKVASISAPQVVRSGADYLVRRDDSAFQRLRCDGTLGAAHESVLSGLVCNDDQTCFGWQHRQAHEPAGATKQVTDIFRFDTTGKSIGTSIARLDDGYSADINRSSGALAVGSGATGKFVLVRNPPGTGLDVVSSSTGLVTHTVGSEYVYGLTLATDGSRLAWFDSGRAWTTDLAGNKLAERSFDYAWTGKPPPFQGQIFDGFSYVIRTAPKVVLLDTSLGDSQQFAFQESSSDGPNQQYYASNQYGRTLLARTAYLDDEAGWAIVARFLDNDLAPNDPGNVPGNCDVSGPIVEDAMAYDAISAATGNGGTGGVGGSTQAGGSGGTAEAAGAGGLGGSTHAGGSTQAGGAGGASETAGSGGSIEAPGAAGSPETGGTSAGSNTAGTSSDANTDGGVASAEGGDAGATSTAGADDAGHAGSAAPSSPKAPVTATGGACSYAPAPPSRAWLWLLSLAFIAQRRRRAT